MNRQLKNYNFVLYGFRHFVELFGIEKLKKIPLFGITQSVPVSLHLYQVTFTDDIYSKVAEFKQNHRSTIFFHAYIFERKSKQYFRWVVNVLTNAIGNHVQKGMVVLLFWQLNSDNC